MTKNGTNFLEKMSLSCETALRNASFCAQSFGMQKESDIALQRLIAYNPQCITSFLLNSENLDSIKIISRLIETIISRSDISIDQWRVLAYCYSQIGDFPNSFASFARINFELNDSVLCYVLGTIYQHFLIYNNAKDCFDRVNIFKLNDITQMDYLFRYSIVLRQSLIYDKSYELQERLKDKPPLGLNKYDLFYQMAYTVFLKGDLRVSHNIISHILEGYPQSKHALELELWVSFYEKKNQTNYYNLLVIIERILKNNPNDPKIMLIAGYISYFFHDYTTSFHYFKECLVYYNHSSAFWQSLGCLYFKNQQYKDAVIAFQNSLFNNPCSVDNWINIGLSFQSLNNDIDAMKCYEKGTQLCDSQELRNIHESIKLKSRSIIPQLRETKEYDLITLSPEDFAKEYCSSPPYITWNAIGIESNSMIPQLSRVGSWFEK